MDGSITGDIFDNAEPEKKDATAAERARRYRARKRDAERDSRDESVTVRGGTLMQPQAGVTWEVTQAGDLILRQEGQSEAQIFIAADYLDGFLETLYALDTSPPPAVPTVEDEEDDGDDDSVVIEGQRRVRVFWNGLNQISVECAGTDRDYELASLHPYEAHAVAGAILRLLESEEVTVVEGADDV